MLISKAFNEYSERVLPVVTLYELSLFDTSTSSIEWMSAILLRNNLNKKSRILSLNQGNSIMFCQTAKTEYFYEGLPIKNTEWLIPFNVSSVHWVLAIVDFDLRTFAVIDSMHPVSPLKDKYYKSFLRFLEKMNSSMNHTLSKIDKDSYHSDKWTNRNIPHDLQTDGHSCGIFVLLYMESYLHGRSMTNLGSLIDYRPNCKKQILENVMIDICLYCGKHKF